MIINRNTGQPALHQASTPGGVPIVGIIGRPLGDDELELIYIAEDETEWAPSKLKHTFMDVPLTYEQILLIWGPLGDGLRVQ